jgi:hypothetical protein
MARTLVLATILTLLSGCDSGQPRPTMYAPTDLAAVLPGRVGDITLQITQAAADDAVIGAYDAYAASWLARHRGAAASEKRVLRSAKVAGIDASSGKPLVMYAVRVDGVPTTDAVALVDDIGLGPSLRGETYRIDGQDVTWAAHGGGVWSQFYQMGEVLFVAVGSSDVDVTVEDVLAELPRCQRKGKEWLEPCRAPS